MRFLVKWSLGVLGERFEAIVDAGLVSFGLACALFQELGSELLPLPSKRRRRRRPKEREKIRREGDTGEIGYLVEKWFVYLFIKIHIWARLSL